MPVGWWCVKHRFQKVLKSIAMRRLCSILCFSLFSSLIHAAGMPLSAPNIGHEHQLHSMNDVNDLDSHAQHMQCDDCTSIDKVVQKTPAKCHVSAQCCLGIATLTSANFIVEVHQYAEDFPAHIYTLATGQALDSIYKPPRA